MVSIYRRKKYFGKNYPIALKTIFGWIFAGSYTTCDDHITPAVTHHADLDMMVRSFMEMDNVQPNQSLLDSSDPTESHFANTHTRSELCLLASSELIQIWRSEQRNVQPSLQLYIVLLTKVSTSGSSTRSPPGLGS